MRGLELEAVYIAGTLQLPRLLPLEEGQKVTITIHPPGGAVKRGYGRLQSGLPPEEIEHVALDPEFDPLEGP